ncbi:MAG: NAD-dependent epimerase/dehydratase family protein [Actinobacteria bacterium]|nr:NAD-dependent epimerase/dehydratase family protein [Actinomycetota bacterium]
MATAGSVIVTGGAGFIGSTLADALVASGREVHVVDNLATGHRANLPEGATFHEVDIRDSAGVARVASESGAVAIFHMAAQADVRKAIEDPAFDADVNIGGTLSVLEAARINGARVMFAATGGGAYGEYDGLPIPTPETADPRPMSHYGQSKLSGEAYCALYGRLYGIPTVRLRLGNVYGPRQDPHGEAGVVAIFSGKLIDGEPMKVFGDGLQTRDYVYVDDVVDAFLRAEGGTPDITLNIGTGREVSVLDLVRILGGGDAVHAPARTGEVQRSALDAALAATVLGWTPTVQVEEGLPRTHTALAAARGV